MSDATTPYDHVVYPAYVHPQTHPAHVAAMARMAGHTPPDVSRARILEVGCGIGSNLLPMALELRGAELVGIDLSPVQIEIAQRQAADLGVDNLRFLARDLCEDPASLGTFDYVIAHGFYSWVPPVVQQALLELCARQLSPSGVAFVSYNALPGWHLRGAVRDLMRFGARGQPDPHGQVEAGRAFIETVTEHSQCTHPAWGALLRFERRGMRHDDDAYLLHEFLAPQMEPLYFEEFTRRAAGVGLSYITEADEPANLLPERFPALSGLPGFGEDRIATEQAIDLLVGRPFRQALLTPAPGPFHPPRDGALESLQVACSLRPDGPVDVRPEGRMKFKGGKGMSLSVQPLAARLALLALAERWPGTIFFPDLVARITRALPTPEREGAPDVIRGHVFAAWLEEEVTLRTLPCTAAASPPTLPRVTALARAQARAGEEVTTLRHTRLRLDPLPERLTPLLDGTHDAGGLLALLRQGGGAADLSLERIEEALKSLCRAGLIEGTGG